MAVRLAIRPRLRLAPDWQPGPAPRRRFRLPPLALPAAGYWAAMAGLTYVFTQLGPHPLDDLFASPPPVSAPAPVVEAPPGTPLASREPARPLREPEATSRALAPEPAPTGEAMTPAEDARPTRAVKNSAPALEARAPAAPPPPLPVEPSRPALSFPDFTDSAPSRPWEGAADGPRIDSLFEPAEAPRRAPNEPAPSVARAELPAAGTGALQSCEAAVARNEERLEIGGPRGPADITREAYASILQNGSYLSGCNVPERTVLEVCAAVKQGRAVGVTVTSSPPSAELGACVRRAVSRLAFPHSERLDVTHTRFDAARR